MNEREAYIALNMMEKIGPVTVRNLSNELGSAAALFETSVDNLQSVGGIRKATVSAILEQRDSVDWQGELKRAEASEVRIITQVDGEYPSQLMEIHDPPLALYVCGSFNSVDIQSIAIVGTRRPTHYGRDITDLLTSQLCNSGFSIISGLATGIDTVAHKSALKAKGRTIAVLGGGLDCLYPAANKGLAREITKTGAVITEFPFGKNPDRTTFPMRNRIVSGLSLGVLVVEAGLKSGALITANQALEQGRSVFAVPGRVDSPMSCGSNFLIKKGASLVENVDDILSEYEFMVPSSMSIIGHTSVPRPRLSSEEISIVDLLEEGFDDVDCIIRETGLKTATVSSLLIGLEMKKVIRMLPGRVIELVR